MLPVKKYSMNQVKHGQCTDLDIKVDYLNPDERWSGCDFLRNAKHDCIDFACIHMYQEKWAPEKDKVECDATQSHLIVELAM